MASCAIPGPVCQETQPITISDGTNCRAPSPQPGSVCVMRGGIRGYAARVRNLKKAFILGIDKYAYQETAGKVGEDLHVIVEGLWPGFIQALKIYAWSIGTGATVLGVVGGVIGEGVGAVPGAMLGADLGADVASAILFFMGLKFLADYVLTHLEEATKHFENGYQSAWNACGSHPPLDTAAHEFGQAIANLASLMLQAAAAWVLRKGLQAGLEELNKSKMGKALAPYARLQYWREKIGVTDAPVPREGIGTTLRFFDDQVGLGKLENMPEFRQLSYMKAMDFSKEVTTEKLQPGKELVGYRDPSSPFGYFYTEPGVFLDRLGVDYVTEKGLPKGVEGPKQLVPREFIRYRVKQGVDVIKSTSSGVRAWDTGRPVPGGGKQYFIPKAWDVLEVVPNSK